MRTENDRFGKYDTYLTHEQLVRTTYRLQRRSSVANKQKARLTMRRIVLLIETGDSAVMDLIDKLCKIKPGKATA